MMHYYHITTEATRTYRNILKLFYVSYFVIPAKAGIQFYLKVPIHKCEFRKNTQGVINLGVQLIAGNI